MNEYLLYEKWNTHHAGKKYCNESKDTVLTIDNARYQPKNKLKRVSKTNNSFRRAFMVFTRFGITHHYRKAVNNTTPIIGRFRLIPIFKSKLKQWNKEKMRES